MAKLNTIYIWFGKDTVVYVRGTPPKENREGFFDIEKFKFSRKWSAETKPITNIPVEYVSEGLRPFNGRFMKGMANYIIHIDFFTGEPNHSKQSPTLLARYKSNLTELESFKRMYFEEKQKNLDRENRDRLKDRIKQDFKFAGDIRRELFTYDNNWNNVGFRSGRGVDLSD